MVAGRVRALPGPFSRLCHAGRVRDLGGGGGRRRSSPDQAALDGLLDVKRAAPRPQLTLANPKVGTAPRDPDLAYPVAANAAHKVALLGLLRQRTFDSRLPLMSAAGLAQTDRAYDVWRQRYKAMVPGRRLPGWSLLDVPLGINQRA